MILMPIVYVTDIDRSREFYGHLGFTAERGSRTGDWQELRGGGGVLALHRDEPRRADPQARVELCMLATEPLEDIAARLDRPGSPATIIDEAFGRSLRVTDPDGMAFQVNEHDHDLYT